MGAIRQVFNMAMLQQMHSAYRITLARHDCPLFGSSRFSPQSGESEKVLSLTVKQFQILLGLMAAASNVIPFGLLYMRPQQWWLNSKGFSPRGNPFRMIKVTRRCLRALNMWRKPWFLSQGPVLGAPCRRVTLATDASLTGWGAVMSGHPAHGLWSGHHLTWPHQLPGDAGRVSSTKTFFFRT